MVLDGVRRCDCAGHHPILALSEPDGERWLNVRLSPGEADHLAHELAGSRSRASVIYALFEELLSALGWRVTAVRLTGTEHHEMLGLVEVTRGSKRAGVRAHPGDAVVLASRSAIAVDVPLELAQVGGRGLSQPWLACNDAADVAGFRRLLDSITPDDFAR